MYSILRKVAAILLIVLFLFNLIGYRIMFAYSLQLADQQMEAVLDKSDYYEADLITISVPLSLPYLNDQTDFERVSGELNYNGRLLKYVKQKISNGNLVLLCLTENASKITDKQYFTKRPTFYPGPGIWPSEGRSYSASFIIKL